MKQKFLALLLILCLLLAGCEYGIVFETAPASDPAETLESAATEAPAQTEATEATEATAAPEKEKPSYATGELEAGADTLTVHFIDVGQADCALIECGNAYALIDGGYPEGGEIAVEYMEKLGIQRLNLVVGTHPHGDHIGGLPTVLKNIPADNTWFSAIPFTNAYVNDFLYAASQYGNGIQQPEPGQTFQLGGATITVLGPVHTKYEDANDISLVLMVQFGDIRFLFTGDMEQIAETDLINSGADLQADVLKVGHHGSYSSTSYQFLRSVAPTFAVISCGRANEYGHPHDDPMSRLRDAEVTIFRTDKMYNVVAVTDGENIRFTWDNTYAKPWSPES